MVSILKVDDIQTTAGSTYVDGGDPSGDFVTGAVAGISAGAVGSYAFCVWKGNTANAPTAGTTVSGSLLRYGAAGEPSPYSDISTASWQSGAYTLNQGGSALAGTWRSMGGGGVSGDTDAYIYTLYLRIS